MPIDPVIRFWRFVATTDNPNDCWLWLGGKGSDGYGIFRTDKSIRAHRFSYQLAFGPIPHGLSVLHKCDKPPCVNPRHLFVGTHQENMNDAYEKGRYPHIRQGEENNLAKLSEKQVREILSLAGIINQRQIAKQFNVHPATICLILKGKNWSHLQKAVPETL